MTRISLICLALALAGCAAQKPQPVLSPGTLVSLRAFDAYMRGHVNGDFDEFYALLADRVVYRAQGSRQDAGRDELIADCRAAAARPSARPLRVTNISHDDRGAAVDYVVGADDRPRRIVIEVIDGRVVAFRHEPGQ